MKESLISVIVPIYKVEAYLSRCVDSIINQTYKNLEIILVDDGSPDNCPIICDEYAMIDNRIKVVHKENGGLSDARNAGMNVATGKYISFVDSDDWIEPNMLEVLCKKAYENDFDIVSGGVMMVWNDDTPSKMLTNLNGDVDFYNTEEALENFINSRNIIQTVWNKLYKYSVIKDIPFPSGKINEDEYWSWQVVANSDKIASLECPLYNYLQRNGSIMQGGSKFNPMNVIEAKCERIEYIRNKYPRLYDICSVDLLYCCLFQAQRAKLLLPNDKYKEYIKQIRKTTKKYPVSKEYYKNISYAKKIRISSIKNAFGLVCWLQNKKNIGNESNI